MAAGDLTTLANLKQWLNLTTDAADELLSRLITAASGWVQQYLNRRIASQTYTEVRDGHGGSAIFCANYPVTAVSSVKINSLVIPPAPDNLRPGYLFTDKRILLQDYQFVRGQGNVELAYTAGFAATPPELEQATIQLVALRYKERDHIGQDSAAMQGQNVTFSKDLPADLKQVLDSWKKVVPV